MLNSEQKYFELKECSKCGAVYPATDEYFGRTKQSCDGLKKTCKVCISKYNKEYQIKNKDRWKSSGEKQTSLYLLKFMIAVKFAMREIGGSILKVKHSVI